MVDLNTVSAARAGASRNKQVGPNANASNSEAARQSIAGRTGAFQPQADRPPSRTGHAQAGRRGLRCGWPAQARLFPEGAVLSLLTVLENGSAIETANKVSRAKPGQGVTSPLYKLELLRRAAKLG